MTAPGRHDAIAQAILAGIITLFFADVPIGTNVLLRYRNPLIPIGGAMSVLTLVALGVLALRRSGVPAATP